MPLVAARRVHLVLQNPQVLGLLVQEAQERMLLEQAAPLLPSINRVVQGLFLGSPKRVRAPLVVQVYLDKNLQLPQALSEAPQQVAKRHLPMPR